MISKLLSILCLLVSIVSLAQTNPKPFNLSLANYTLNEWDDSATAGTYPVNMIFHMTSIKDDTVFIANSNYACAYHSTSRTRINGNDSLGFSFLNTETSKTDLCSTSGTTTIKKYCGAAVLTLNATNRNNIQANWSGRMLSNLKFDTSQTRFYAIKLQYRTDSTTGFTNVPNSQDFNCNSDSNVYKTKGSVEQFSNIILPNNCNNQPFLQLRWAYVKTKNTKGERPELGVDDILITSDIFTSITNKEKKSELKAYPNPSQNHIINFNKNISGEVISILGNVILSFDTINRIDLTNSPIGIYFIKTSNGDNVKLFLQ